MKFLHIKSKIRQIYFKINCIPLFLFNKKIHILLKQHFLRSEKKLSPENARRRKLKLLHNNITPTETK